MQPCTGARNDTCTCYALIQGTSKRLFPGFVKLDEKVGFCLPTAGRRTQFFHPTISQPGKSLSEVPCICCTLNQIIFCWMRMMLYSVHKEVQRSAKRCGCLPSYSLAEPERELAKPRNHHLAEPCITSLLLKGSDKKIIIFPRVSATTAPNSKFRLEYLKNVNNA